MKDSTFKWYLLAAIIIFGMPMFALTVQGIGQTMAKTAILTSCYKAGRPNCVNEYAEIIRIERSSQ